MKPKIIGYLLIISLIALSCKKNEMQPIDPADKSMEQMTVSPSFNWETTKHINVSLTASVSGVVFIQSADGSNCFHKGFLSNEKAYTTSISIPSYMNEVRLMLNGVIYTYPLSGNRIDHRFN